MCAYSDLMFYTFNSAERRILSLTRKMSIASDRYELEAAVLDLYV